MKLLVGLGNPGTKYAMTRHNIGFRVVDELASRWSIDMSREKFHGWFGDGMIAGQKAVLLKPTTFMNRSGQAVLGAGRFYQIDWSDLLVISDDYSIDLGRMRCRGSGSAGGHNGLSDIIQRCGGDEFARLRLGIGPVVGSTVNFVLERFGPDEETVVEKVARRAADAVECWVNKGTEDTMNRFNGLTDLVEPEDTVDNGA